MNHVEVHAAGASPADRVSRFAHLFSTGTYGEPSAVYELLKFAKTAPDHWALSSRGLRRVDSSKVQLALSVRCILRSELAGGVAHTLGEVAHMEPVSGRSHSVRVGGALKAMAKECAQFIDHFSVEDEDTLIALSRACLGALQSMRRCGGAGDLALTEMTKIVWQAQSAAQYSLKHAAMRRVATSD